MTRTTWIAALTLALSPLPSFAQGRPDAPPAWEKPGKLGEAGRGVAALFSWEYDGRVFRFGPETWDEACAGLDPAIFTRVEANGFFQHVKKFHAMSEAQAKIFRQVYGLAARLSLPQSSVSSSNDSISVSAKSDALEVSASWDGKTARAACRERLARARSLEISLRDGDFSLEIKSGDSEDRFVITASDEVARLRVIRGGEEVKNLTAPSFFKLYLDRRAFFEDEVFPTFQSFGVPRPALPMDPGSLQEILRLLRPAPEATRERVAALLGALRSADLEAREEATAALADSYPAFEPAIHEALAAEDISPEERFRLSLLKDRIGGRAESVRLLLERGRLLEHPEFRRLLLEAARPDERAQLRRRLEMKAKRFY